MTVAVARPSHQDSEVALGSPRLEAAWETILASVEAATRLEEQRAWSSTQGLAVPRTKDLGITPYPWETISADHQRDDVAADAVTYQRWYQAHYGNPGPPGSVAVTEDSPTFSILVPVFRPERWHIERCVASVLAQTYPKWELCLCDDASGDASLSAYLLALQSDPRIKVVTRTANGGISAATNDALEVAQGDFVALLDNDDELVEVALEKMAQAIAENPTVDLLYSDEDKLDAAGRLCYPAMKPAWSPDYLLSSAYTCHLTVLRTSVTKEIGGFRSQFDGSQDYDITLRVSEVARQVLHVPEVLYHWRIRQGSAADDPQAKPWAHLASEAALNDALRRRGEAAHVLRGPQFGVYHIRRSLPPETTTSIVMMLEESPRAMGRALRSLRHSPAMADPEVVVVDTRLEAPDSRHLGAALGQDGTIYLRAPGASWAEAANLGASATEGDCIAFVSERLMGASTSWLRVMVEHALRPGIAAVGPRIATPDAKVFSAGAVVGLRGAVGPLFQGLDPSSHGYLTAAELTRNCSAIPRWCLVIGRAGWESSGGFGAEMGAFTEIDLCLRLGEEGMRCLYTPLARFVIAPCTTPYEAAGEEVATFANRWSVLIADGDPFWSRHLSRSSSLGALDSCDRSGEDAT